MLQNSAILCIGVVLAASWFLVHLPFLPNTQLATWLVIFALNFAVFVCLLVLYGFDSASTVTLVSMLFAVVGKLLAINFKMVQSANYPKHRRCY
jgi:hypothetical protein